MTHTALVENMKLPDFYPHRPKKVELIQTHISFIFIAGDYVYKVKKSVDLGFLDFTSLEKRKYYCNEELKLNRRLASDIYLDVVAVYENKNQRLSLDKGERIVEYALVMKKIPEERMLKKILLEGETGDFIMEAIARKLASFHEQAETGGKIDELGGIETIQKNHDENFAQTKPFINLTISEYQYNFIKEYIYGFINKYRDHLIKRVKTHRIRDCHGDLHLEHICVMGHELPPSAGSGIYDNIDPDKIIIFDCIEFNERFRYSDVAADVAFFAMDLDYNDYMLYADKFVKSYIKYSGDLDLFKLLNFYKCYYAYVRGKVIGFKINDERISLEERHESIRIARKYFDLAYSYAARLDKPALIIMSGLMGTGKSLIASRIASILGAGLIKTDVLRKEILNIIPTERHYEKFGEGIYSDAVTRKTYDFAIETATEILKESKSVIIDASFRKREDRIKAFEAAQQQDANFFIIECICEDDIIKERLDSRMTDRGEASDGRWEVFHAQKEAFDPVTEIQGILPIIVDTSKTPEECERIVIQKLKAV